MHASDASDASLDRSVCMHMSCWWSVVCLACLCVRIGKKTSSSKWERYKRNPVDFISQRQLTVQGSDTEPLLQTRDSTLLLRPTALLIYVQLPC
jgi:hypothetical protein